MPKRKQPDHDPTPDPEITETPSKRRRKSTGRALSNGVHEDEIASIPLTNGTPKKADTPSRRKRKSAADSLLDENENDEGSPTPKASGRTLFSTPRKNRGKVIPDTPSKSARADKSAKRKSARLLAEAQDEDDWDGQDALARAILEDEEEDEGDNVEQTVEELTEGDSTTPVRTGKRGRPKGAKNKRSPTPEGDIPPEERYFFQNRSGPPQISDKRFSTVKLLTHEEYVECISAYQDRHAPEKRQLMKLHARSFPQWRFELDQGFSLCLYGYGSKKQLVKNFAEWAYKRSNPAPRIVMVNGDTPKLSVRGILHTVSSAILPLDENLRLIGPPHEMLDTLLARLSSHPPPGQLYVMIHSIDAAPLRGTTTQSVLARLAAHHLIHFLATADTPTFATQWNSSLLDQFRFAFHDCTTFASNDSASTEVSIVDEVHELLGRKRSRAGGKEGIGFVLKSLPENARHLYRLLLTEILEVLGGGGDNDGAEDEGEFEADNPAASTSHRPNKSKPSSSLGLDAEETTVPSSTLYRKASERFICSSHLNFSVLLREFHDHAMVLRRRDPTTGVEVLGVPLSLVEIRDVLREEGEGDAEGGRT